MEEKYILEEALIGDKADGSEVQNIRTATVSSSVYNLINGILGMAFL